MEEKKIEGTYTELSKNEWYSEPFECNECGAVFMTSMPLTKCYCPECGRYLVWKDAVNGVE